MHAPTPHVHNVIGHVKRRAAFWTPAKCVVTSGVIVAAALSIAGFDHAALWVTIFNNIIWIWE